VSTPSGSTTRRPALFVDGTRGLRHQAPGPPRRVRLAGQGGWLVCAWSGYQVEEERVVALSEG
jgi:hypothetical protein